jgi:endonuclease YncB( thermonuclease family)
MGNCLCSSPSSESSQAPAVSSAPASTPASAPTYSTLALKGEQKDPDLQEATYENTPEFTFKGLRSTVKVLRVIDGDTVDIALAQPETRKIYRHRVRLYGIDTPEKRPSKSDPLRHLEIEASYRAKEALEQRLRENDNIVLATFYQADKYGRLLCTLYDKTGEDLNQWMIARGYATEYFGKTKKKFQPSAPDSNTL